MTYSCGIIKDLLPLYIDDICSGESRKAVDEHLSKCEKCREYYSSMKSTYGFIPKQNDDSTDAAMANSLKRIKLRINKRHRNVVLCSAAAVIAFVLGFNVLFNAAIKEVDVSEVEVSANVYSLDELAEAPLSAEYDSISITISSDEDDDSESVVLAIPELGEITLTENTIEKAGYATVISVSSEYFLRAIKQEIKGDTIYISAFKTTLLNNKAETYQKTMTSLEFSEINKIVFVNKGGEETVLWSRQ